MTQSSLLIDAYAHAGLPRFQTVKDYAGTMARSGIDKAVLCSFESSPDLGVIHRAILRWPDRFRGIGVALGADRNELEASANAQLRAGFSGLRLTEADVFERPWLLELLAANGSIAIICGKVASPKVARVLVDHLEGTAAARIVGGHFAGVGEINDLKNGPVAALFEHSRFHVIFSRQGGYPPSIVQAWAEALIAKIGWSRIVWGSESPVLFWRNETISDAIDWVNALQPGEEDLVAFRGGNANRLFFVNEPAFAPIEMPFAPMDRMRIIPATMWARALSVEQPIAARLVRSWLSSGGSGTLGSHLEMILERALPPLPGDDDEE